MKFVPSRLQPTKLALAKPVDELAKSHPERFLVGLG